MDVKRIDVRFEELYGMKFTDEQREAFLDFMKNSNIKEDNFKIVLKSDPVTFMHELILSREIDISETKQDFYYEDCVFALHPINFPVIERFNILHHGRSSYSSNPRLNSVKIPDEKNIIIIKILKKEGVEFKETYRIVIYNQEIQVVADGIRFVD